MATENEGQGAELTLREQLDAAFTEADTADETPADDVAKPAAPAAAAPGPADPAGDRARDPHGRFAPKQAGQDDPAKGPAAAQAPATPPPGTSAPAVPPAPAPGELKPPASWRPEVREKWAGVDPVVREEIHRREFELQRVLQQGASTRQFVEAFERVVAPYEVFIRQENSSPLQAVQNLMQTAADLRVGTPQHKAQLVAGLVKQYGINVELLDSALAGVAPPAGAGAQEFRDPRFDQFLMQQQQVLQQNRQREEAELQKQLQTFEQSHEFYRDVAGTMADLVEIRSRRGETPDLEKIYQEACKLHEGVSTILQQRAAAQKAGQQSQAVLRAKRAAVSVKGDPTPESGATVPKNDSIRAAIEAAIESSGRS